MISDLTYVRVNYRWNYVCVLIDVYNREIIGFSVGPHKDAALVYDAFATVEGNLSKNQIIDEMLGVFHIKRSLSMKGCLYDNAVAEANFKMFKTEFVRCCNFDSLTQLKAELAGYVHWFNHLRMHGTLDYRSPVEYRLQAL